MPNRQNLTVSYGYYELVLVNRDHTVIILKDNPIYIDARGHVISYPETKLV